DILIIAVLYFLAVDTKSRHPFLGMARQGCGQVYRTGSFGTVKSPNGFGPCGIHVYGLRSVAPTGGYRYGKPYAFPKKFFLTFLCFRYPADGGVRNDTFYLAAVIVP